ncbi:MAG: hypothetical protein WD768_09705, partial [Phycisphaeraceae bacterium]
MRPPCFSILFLLLLPAVLAGCGDSSSAYREAVQVCQDINTSLDAVKTPQDVTLEMHKLLALATRSREIAGRIEKLVAKDPDGALEQAMSVSEELWNLSQKIEANRQRLLASPELAVPLASVLNEL